MKFTRLASFVLCTLFLQVAAGWAADQSAVEVAVYNSDLGLVKDTRKIALPQGEGELCHGRCVTDSTDNGASAFGVEGRLV